MRIEIARKASRTPRDWLPLGWIRDVGSARLHPVVPGLLIRWMITALALWLTSEVVGGISADSTLTLFVAALVLGILNAVIRPVLLILTLPINLVTLGLFTLIINGAMLKLAAWLVPGFHVEGFWAAVGGALLLSVFSFALNLFVSDRGRVEYVYVERR